MKAAQYSQYGEPEVITINEVDKPTFKHDQILVEVYSAAINPFDSKLRRGAMKDSVPLNFPVTIGADFSGVVSEVGETSNLQVGDEVYGSANILGGGSGAVAEFLAANIASVAKKPSNTTHSEAAAAVLVGVSAIQALDQLNLSSGKKILIHGGAGGIGSAAIQYAKHLGATVATTARAADTDFVKSLGADEVIDYESQDFSELLSELDAIFDTIGGETYAKSLKILKPEGIIISMVEKSSDASNESGITKLFQSTKVNTESLDRLREVIEQSVIKPQVDQEFPLEQTAEAFKHLETGHPRGKVVIKVK